MAKFSQAFLQGLLNPSYQQGLFEAARGLGQTPGLMRMERQRKEEEARKQQTARLVASGQQMEDQAKSLANRRRNELLMKQAIQEANRAGDTEAMRAIGLGALDPAEYLKSRATSSGVETVSVSPGGALVDKRTGEVLYERGFKPADTDAPKVSFVKTKDDKQVLVFEGSDLVNTIEVEGDSNEEIAARETVISSTSNTLQTVKEAKETLRQSYLGMDPGGISGALTGLIPGSPSHELMTSTYVTIAGKEALDEINRMKAEAAKFGSRGTGLGQVTQIEFSALQGNLAKLNTGLTVERQLDLLNKIEQKLESTRRIASGENPIDVIDFNEPVYIEAGYVKEGGEVYYFAPGGKEFIYNRNKEAFVPVGG